MSPASRRLMLWPAGLSAALRTALVLPLLAVAACGPHRVAGGASPQLPVLVDPELQDLTASVAVSGHARETPRRLAGGSVNLRGPVYATVFPMTYGLRRPQWREQQVAYNMFGVAGDTLEQADGVAARLADASQGTFRLNAAMVFPPLIDPQATQTDVERAFASPEAMRDLARRVIHPWLERANLASYDNDGPDGLPSSGDDDGRVDLPILLIETDSFSDVTTVTLPEAVRTGPGGRFSTTLGAVTVVAVPRASGLSPDNLGPTTAVLRALGISGADLFLPNNPRGELSTVTRMQLGWLTPQRVTRSGVYGVRDGLALSVPVLDVPDGAGQWYVERGGRTAFATRLIRRADGALITAERRTVGFGQHYVLPLTRTDGSAGPSATLDWGAAGELLVSVELRARTR